MERMRNQPWIDELPAFLKVAMSQELDDLVQLAKSKKTKVRDIEKSEKKRKRKGQDDSQDPSPKKKHRSSKRASETPAATETPRIPPIAPDSPAGSSFHQQTSSLYLPLPPISQSHPLQGLCAEHLSPLILTYYPPFHGVILSYANVQLSSSPAITTSNEDVLARSIDEYAASFIWVTADFLLFRPERGNVLEGWINLQNEGNIGLVCLNFFNASIERKRLPREWRWVSGVVGRSHSSNTKKLNDGISGSESEEEEPRTSGISDVEGQFEDSVGNPVEGLIRFRIKDIETSRSTEREFLSIEGTMLSERDEKELQEQEAIRVQRRELKRNGRPREAEHAMSGALVNGDDEVDEEAGKVRKTKLKHRVAY